MTRRSRPQPGQWIVDSGTAELLPDADSEDAWELSVDGVPQSLVDRADPAHLAFDYVRLVGDVLDLQPDGPLTVLHLGGGACTLPRYVAHLRPGSRQLVVEADALLAEVVRTELGTDGFRLRVGDARAELERVTAGAADVVVGDVFRAAALPPHTSTAEHVALVRRALRDGGTYVLNVPDGPPLAYSRRHAATLRAAFAHVALLADPGVLRGRRFGNLVLAASDEPLPLEGLRRRAARAAGTARVVAGQELQDWCGGARPLTDADTQPSPPPPPEVFRR